MKTDSCFHKLSKEYQTVSQYDGLYYLLKHFLYRTDRFLSSEK